MQQQSADFCLFAGVWSVYPSATTIMDPLGAMEYVVDYKSLEPWNATDVPQYDIIVDDPSSKKISPFKYDANLNKKIILWYIVTVFMP